MNAKKAQTTLTFNETLDAIGNCEVTATVTLWGAVTINSVRRNSDYCRVSLTAAQIRDLSSLAQWYTEDTTVAN